MPGLRELISLGGRTIGAFNRNKGMLLAGAIAYNGLLSLLPLIAVIFALCSLVFDRQLLLSILSDELSILVPGASGLAGEIDALWENRDLIGGIGAAVLLLFSTFAFRAIDDSFAVIFQHARTKRRAWVSALLPLLFVLLVMTGLVLITTLTMLLETAATGGLHMLGHRWTLPDATGVVLHYGGTIGLAVLFAAIYWIIPPVRVRLRDALVGGFTAAILWELVRRAMVWYFANVSMVNTIYGSAAAIIVLLLSFEAAAIILLLGAQVIAELGDESRSR